YNRSSYNSQQRREQQPKKARRARWPLSDRQRDPWLQVYWAAAPYRIRTFLSVASREVGLKMARWNPFQFNNFGPKTIVMGSGAAVVARVAEERGANLRGLTPEC